MEKKLLTNSVVTFLNPKTCGIYKNGEKRFRTDNTTGLRTNEEDNELIDYVDAFLRGETTPGESQVNCDDIFSNAVMVPTYYDQRYSYPIEALIKEEAIEGVTIGELQDDGIILVRGGHGSPGNDQRSGSIPYIKVSDIRALRVNINPTNLVSEAVAHLFWRGNHSNLKAWDLITPNRASNNIGEFAVILPGEEQIVVTKEVFVFRILEDSIYDPFYLLWALSLHAVRLQWRRIALMQTNREDCGVRYREIIIPRPPNKTWANKVSKPFSDYFQTISSAKETFHQAIVSDGFQYVASASSVNPYNNNEQDDYATDEVME